MNSEKIKKNLFDHIHQTNDISNRNETAKQKQNSNPFRFSSKRPFSDNARLQLSGKPSALQFGHYTIIWPHQRRISYNGHEFTTHTRRTNVPTCVKVPLRQYRTNDVVSYIQI